MNRIQGLQAMALSAATPDLGGVAARMAQNWMVRAAPLLEYRFPGLPDGPVSIALTVPDANTFDIEGAYVEALALHAG